MSRPEYQLPPEFFYNKEEAQKYSNCSRIIDVQSQMSERALELLNIPVSEENWLILDIGCGSGISGSIITENDHMWVGVDISNDMLKIAQEREVEGELVQKDIGQGLNFKPGVFDAAISISAVQWLCVAGKKNDNPFQRMAKFFSSLYVLQIYPDSSEQIDMLTKSALKAGFFGTLVVDFPHSSKAKKMYLVLETGGGPVAGSMEIVMVEGKNEEDEETEDKIECLDKFLIIFDLKEKKK